MPFKIYYAKQGNVSTKRHSVEISVWGKSTLAPTVCFIGSQQISPLSLYCSKEHISMSSAIDVNFYIVSLNSMESFLATF